MSLNIVDTHTQSWMYVLLSLCTPKVYFSFIFNITYHCGIILIICFFSCMSSLTHIFIYSNTQKCYQNLKKKGIYETLKYIIHFS